MVVRGKSKQGTWIRYSDPWLVIDLWWKLERVTFALGLGDLVLVAVKDVRGKKTGVTRGRNARGKPGLPRTYGPTRDRKP